MNELETLNALPADFTGYPTRKGCNVRFFKDKIKLEHESRIKGEEVFKDLEMVEIQNPGSIDKFVCEVRDRDKEEFAEQYLAFKSSTMPKIEGYSLERWTHIPRDRALQFKVKGFHTVEQIANATDAIVNTLGFDGFQLRDAAIQFLKDEENSGEKKVIKDLMTMNQELLARLEALEDKKEKPKKEKSKVT